MKNPISHHRTGKGASRPTKGRSLKNFTNGLRVAVLLLVLSGAATAGYQAYVRMNKPIQEIQLSGEFNRSWSDQIQRKFSDYAGVGLLSLDLEQVQLRIETTPWVARAQVSRQWPSVLEVNLVQHRLVARWGTEGYVSDQGILVQGYQVNEELPLLQSSIGDPHSLLDQYRLLSQAMSQLDLKLEELHENYSGDLELVLNNGIKLKLGNKELLSRVQRFMVVWSIDLHKKSEKIGQIDARYANGLAVNWEMNWESGAQEGAAIQQMGDRYGDLARR
jgi:cell division protein FtsQ|tara:strand:+ start:133062 stop:133889 length:828 start_codon:yes stop_codon:yes gene_type:complete